MSAWSVYYSYGFRPDFGSPHAYGLLALKRELAYNGCGQGLVLDIPVFGDAMRARTREWQERMTIHADGVIGPGTARSLFRKRVHDGELQYRIPYQYICKQISLESAWDPGATGSVDPRDRGLVQINAGAHPEVSDAEAFDPAFAIPWSAKVLRGHYDELRDWDAALAAHNIGLYYARKWLAAGKPASGVLTATGKDMAVIATKYVALITSRSC